MSTYADRLAEFSIDLKPDSLPADVVHQAELSSLDFVGVVLAAGVTPAAGIVTAYALTQGGVPEATLIGSRDKAPMALAALVNGARAHSIELDDHEAHMRSKVHSGAVIMPAAWAASELRGLPVSGPEFLAAVVVGYDVIGRLSAATSYPDFLGKKKGFHTTPLFGPFAAAATAGRLLGLTAEQLSNAFGICGSLCSGLQETVAAGAMMKCFHAGWAAHSGIMAAQLAQRGYTGPRTIFEGRRGFYNAFCGPGEYDLSVIDRDFGAEYDISLIMYKPYACGGGIHPTLTAIDQLRAEYGLTADQVDRVTVRTSEKVVDAFVQPREAKYSPQSGPQAQHSLPYAAAALITDGMALLDQFTDEAVRRPAVQALAQRIDVEIDPSIQSDDPEDEPASVTIRLTDGRELTASVRGGKGSLAVPMSDAELIAKYRMLAAPSLGDRLEAVQDRVLHLAGDPDVSDVPAGLSSRE
jgi:2-methylcitrate dehydratase PrpD